MRLFFSWVMLSLLTVCFAACQQAPLQIGFSANLTGKFSDVGVDHRDGVIMAVEEFNARGGIRGRFVELLVEDDQEDLREAVAVDARLIDKGVPVIMGHVLSSMTLAALPQMNEKKVLLLNSVSFADELSFQDDFLIRFTGDTRDLAKGYGQFALESLKIKKAALILDRSNEKYSMGWAKHFSETLKDHGSEVIYQKRVDFKRQGSFSNLADEVLRTKPDGILIVASSLDTALVVQNIRKRNLTIPLLISTWAITEDLEKNAGENLVHSYTAAPGYDRDSQTPHYLDFQKRFLQRYGRRPSFTSFSGYQMAFFLVETLRDLQDFSAKSIRDALLKKKDFPGLQGRVVLNAWGDALTTPVFFMYQQGKYRRIHVPESR